VWVAVTAGKVVRESCFCVTIEVTSHLRATGEPAGHYKSGYDKSLF